MSALPTELWNVSRWAVTATKKRCRKLDGTPVLVRLPEIKFIDDKSGKPGGINQHRVLFIWFL
jgi:hypothetical protein